jgi:hypothetical protein
MKKQVEKRLQDLETKNGHDDQPVIRVIWDDDDDIEPLQPGDVVIWMDQDGEVHSEVTE